MKIKDVIISEAQVAGAPGNVTKTGTGASGFPVNQPGVLANQRPNMVRDPRLLTNIDGGQGAIAGAQASAARNQKKPAPKKAAAKKAAPAAAAADPSIDPYDPSKDTNVTQVAASDGTSADLDRLKQLAIGGTQPAPAAAAAPAAPEAPANPGTAAAGIAFNQGSLGTRAPEPQAEPVAGQRPGGIAFNQDAGTTPGQAAQPAPEPAAAAPAPAAQPAPAAPSTVAPVVKTGSGGTLTTSDGKPVTSRSDDEIAWAQKNPYQPYPGPGWQEKQKAQGDANAAAVKGFLNKINPFAKKEPAPVAGQGGQAAPANPGSPQAPAAFRQGQMESAELAIIRKLSGLK
jgi:hypothetical protein